MTMPNRDLTEPVYADEPAAFLTPLQLFDALARELDAGRALITMLLTPTEKNRAAAHSLLLARDLIHDARDLLAAAEAEGARP